MSRAALACFLVLLVPLVGLAGDYERGITALFKRDYDTTIAACTAVLQKEP
jgi:hypothetical protein